MHNHKPQVTTHTHFKGYAIHVARNVMQRARSERVDTWGLANSLAWKVTQTLHPWNLHYAVSLYLRLGKQRRNLCLNEAPSNSYIFYG
jgi:hypothetical protein